MTVFNIETLNALGARLYDHADSITNVAAHEMELDLRLLRPVCQTPGVTGAGKFILSAKLAAGPWRLVWLRDSLYGQHNR